MIRILVADDHCMVRQGLRRMIEDHDDLTVVAEAADFTGVFKALAGTPVDVAVLDLSMPGEPSVDLIAQAKGLQPQMAVLVNTTHAEDPYITRSLRSGADGYMTKENAAEDLIVAIRRVASGGRYVCSAVAERLATSIATRDAGEDRHTQLTEREYQVFELLVSGRRGWEIADRLALSEKTVSTHKAHVLKKMRMTNRTELLLYAIRHQLVAV